MRRPSAATVGWAAAAATFTVNGLRYRRRVQALPVLDAAGGPAPTGYTAVTAAGVRLDDATFRAAAALAAARELDVVDLVPGDLPAERLVDLVRWHNPRTYGTRPLALGRTAAHALVASDDVLARARVERTSGLGAAEMDRLAVLLRRHAPFTSTVALVPWLRSAVVPRRERWGRHTATFLGAAGDAVTARGAGLAALVAGAARRRPLALAALAAYQAQVVVATAGTQARPRDAGPAAVFRPLLAAVDVAASAAGGVAHVRRPDPAVEAKRGPVPRPAGRGRGGRAARAPPRRLPDLRVDRPHARTSTPTTCCRASRAGSASTSAGAAGTLFQNPRLTHRGPRLLLPRLLRRRQARTRSRSCSRPRRRATRAGSRSSAGHAEPRRWLDVGTGHGHFCLAARERWPEAEFDGLDLSDAIDEAAAPGLGRDAATGACSPSWPPTLAGRYDVVSMHHYLEHTREPRRRARRGRDRARAGRLPADRGARPRVPAGPAARAGVGALVPAPAPAPHPARHAAGDAGRAGLHGRRRRAGRRPPERRPALRRGPLGDGPPAAGRRALGRGARAARPHRAQRRPGGLRPAHGGGRRRRQPDLAAGQALVAEHLPGAGPLRRAARGLGSRAAGPSAGGVGQRRDAQHEAGGQLVEGLVGDRAQRAGCGPRPARRRPPPAGR